MNHAEHTNTLAPKRLEYQSRGCRDRFRIGARVPAATALAAVERRFGARENRGRIPAAALLSAPGSPPPLPLRQWSADPVHGRTGGASPPPLPL
ncbi:MAG: hypothetical protein JXR77_08340, partial [Lentisphaeria bacterium]|nr:hypothetical protein [Lentisphaeria bacterium]